MATRGKLRDVTVPRDTARDIGRHWIARPPFPQPGLYCHTYGLGNEIRDRPKANLRKFRGYSSDCPNHKYEAISEGFVAEGPGFEP
jgi:hypothetical protein